MEIGDICRLRLESIVPGGDALARFEGKPVFVEKGAPDETILCRIIEDRKTWARAELMEIVNPSPERIQAKCAFYKKCGGCSLQHITYDAQLAAKTGILKDSFLKIGAIEIPQPEIFPSPPWEYRNRMQFHCFRQKKSDSKFGLMGQGGEIIAISDCPVAVPAIRDILKKGQTLSLPPEKDRFTVFAKDGVLLNEGGTQKGKIKLLDKEISLDAGVFFQSNCLMLEKLVLDLRKTAEGADTSLPAADLYCGAGTFAVFLGELFPKIILAEENKTSVSLARENLKGINAEYFALRDTEWAETFIRCKTTPEGFGFAVTDPPRTGLAAKLAAALACNGPPVIAYVSCDAASLSRDSKILTNGGYKLKEIKLFDFYPQTAHIESLAVFER
ncbi:MAG: class I SAM-dependent RNA methyltransferase [Treponema sp.]|jgi:23S rRNA (uracil1939-C5)-methyltransferase|nr:class I SAM-dependent RNA methyltransferase [Treponema sp.]